jgi:hypothetical protein
MAVREKRLLEKLTQQTFNEANDSKILGKALKTNLPIPNQTLYYVKFPTLNQPQSIRELD